MSEFLTSYMRWPELLRSALEEPVEGRIEEREFRGLAVVGMGGSGIVGDVIKSLTSGEVEYPVEVVKDIKLPRWVREGWLVLSVSYSGNTFETIEATEEAIERGCSVAVVTSGGKLGELASSRDLPRYYLPRGFAPRAAFPAILVGSVKVLAELGLLAKEVLNIDLSRVSNVEGAIHAGKELSNYLEGFMPVFISNVKYYPLALRGKNEFNENAKLPAKFEIIPEWGHNDIVGWEGWAKFPLKAVLFRDVNDPLTSFAEEFLRGAGVSVKSYEVGLRDFLTEVIWYSMVIGAASIHHAIKRGVNPEVTLSIKSYKQFIKKELAD